MSPARADVAFVEARVRAHLIIENGSHYVRDVTFAEDHSLVMAAFHNTTIALLRAGGESNIASACRRLAAHPWQAFALLGIPRPTIK